MAGVAQGVETVTAGEKVALTSGAKAAEKAARNAATLQAELKNQGVPLKEAVPAAGSTGSTAVNRGS